MPSPLVLMLLVFRGRVKPVCQKDSTNLGNLEIYAHSVSNSIKILLMGVAEWFLLEIRS